MTAKNMRKLLIKVLRSGARLYCAARWRFFLYTLGLQHQKKNEERKSSVIFQLDPNLFLSEESEISEKENFLRALLRRFPYWYRGHLLLSENLFTQKKYQESYICLLTVEKFLPTEISGLKSRLLLVLGYPQESLRAFQQKEIDNVASLSSQELEHYLAILLALDDREKLERILQHLPTDRKSAPISTVEAYLKIQPPRP